MAGPGPRHVSIIRVLFECLAYMRSIMENVCHIALSMQCAHVSHHVGFFRRLETCVSLALLSAQAPGFKLQTSPFGQDVRGLQLLGLYGHASTRRPSVLAGTRKCMGHHGAASSCDWRCLCITINTLKLLVITSRPFHIFLYLVPLLGRRVPSGTWKLASSSSLQKN